MLEDKKTAVFLTISAIVVIAVLIFGFLKIGSPAHQRDLASDNRRVNDLSSLAQEIYNVVNPPLRHNQTSTIVRALPETLDELPQIYTKNPRDPVTGEPYEYRPLEGNKYELCATFATEAVEEKNTDYYGPRIFKTHPAGRHCFTLDASKQPYETTAPYQSEPVPAKPIY